MKTTLKTSLIALLAVSALTFTGCKKAKDGETGPAGTNGMDGNANVTATTYSVSTWTYSSPAWSANLAVPALDPDNINTAAVMVYFGSGTNTWTAAPNTYYNSSGNYFSGFVTSVGNVKVTWIYNGVGSGDDPNDFFGTTTTAIKVVVIPPAGLASHPDVDLKNYESVKHEFSLRD